jgi:hypothetical protein
MRQVAPLLLPSGASGQFRARHEPASGNASPARMAGLSHNNLPVQIRKIALRGNLGRAGRCHAEAPVSGRARPVTRAVVAVGQILQVSGHLGAVATVSVPATIVVTAKQSVTAAHPPLAGSVGRAKGRSWLRATSARGMNQWRPHCGLTAPGPHPVRIWRLPGRPDWHRYDNNAPSPGPESANRVPPEAWGQFNRTEQDGHRYTGRS